MSTSDFPLATTIGIALIASAVGTGIAITTATTTAINYTDHAVQKALAEQLPAAVSQTLENQKAEQINQAKEKILANWSGAAANAVNGRHIYGNTDAQFTLVEYSDFECPFCKRFHDTPKQLVDQSGGRVNWEWQHYPLAFHNPAAEVGAHASECVGELAGNKAFWAFTGEWFARTQLNGQGVDDIERIAQEVGAPLDAYRQCMESGKYKEMIQKQMDRGTSLGVTGTPATVVVDNTTGNTLLVKGAQSSQVLLQAIQQLLDKRGQAPSQEPSPSQNDGVPDAAMR